ncbi:MAG: hypothetical protein RQ855_08590 [Desulfurococcales archaeon]|nr:hypothetical protein [Desulfurococcales archaeon]
MPIRDDRVSKLITWYVKALQNAIDIIWDTIKWRYCFQELVRKGKKLVVIRGSKVMIPIFRGIGLLRKGLEKSLWR